MTDTSASSVEQDEPPRWARIWLTLESIAYTASLQILIFAVILLLSHFYVHVVSYYTPIGVDPIILAVIAYLLLLSAYAILTIHNRAVSHAGGDQA